ncbi:hypothetical protein D9C73_016391 [Collichthys lucidus]|uniref:Uncharacterized protein n=1 Tax=Collichthys lucidus TaxID=240159 RepID=A0A4V6AQY2_COLLU|nr:hypothetical protein D9C73_016391 [Collichthys lucidus]
MQRETLQICAVVLPGQTSEYQITLPMERDDKEKDGTRLPEKGATTGSIIGAIIGVIILLAIIGTAIAMYRKHRNNKLNGEGPPKYKPPPPKKTNSSTNRLNPSYAPPPVTDDRPESQYYNTQTAEPVTARRTHGARGEQEDEGSTNTGTMVSDTAETPSQWGRHASLERNRKREKLIERVKFDKGHRQ